MTTYAHTFLGVQPPPLRNSAGFDHVDILQAATPDGPFTQIDTQQIAVDPSPEQPDLLDLTTTAATQARAWFAFIFRRADDVQAPPSVAILSPADATLVTVEDLAALLPARTGQRLTGTAANQPANSTVFPDDTRVQQVIDMASATVLAILGGQTLADKFKLAARYLIVLKAAMLLEPSAWPEQARPDKSAWEQWKEQYDADLEQLQEAIVRDAVDGDSGDGGPDASDRLMPLWSFPAAHDPAGCWENTYPEGLL